MICPTCKKENLLSTVRENSAVASFGNSIVNHYWDELGAYHCHNPFSDLTRYYCSNNHYFSIEHKNPCPADGCEYGK